MIRILLVDDQALFTESLKIMIEIRADDMEVVGIGINGREAIEKAEILNPDIILMDVRMPGLSGVQAACEIHKNHPEIRIMMLTSFNDEASVYDALAAGAIGYLLKNMSFADLMNSIRAVNNRIMQISPDVAAKFVKGMEQENPESINGQAPEDTVQYDIGILSHREREILYLMSLGYDNTSIAEKLYIADQTVKNHISRIYFKLNIHDRMSVMKAAKNSELKEYCRYLLDLLVDNK